MIITTIVLFSEYTSVEVKNYYGWYYVALKCFMVLINLLTVIYHGYRPVFFTLVKLKNLANFYYTKLKNLVTFHFL